MVASEEDIIRDTNERDNLQRAMADLETAIAVANPATRRILENSLQGMRGRITTLNKKIEEAKIEHAAEVQTQAATAAALAAKETALSASEREKYKGFLQEAYFTKKDVGKLDEFYAHSYDRLSEGGKEEMSQRLHEGIRRGELKLEDLPESIRKRDAQLTREHDAVGMAEPVGNSSRADKQTRTAGTSTVNAGRRVSVEPQNSVPTANIDLSSIDLKGIKMVAGTSEPAAATIPDASGPRTKARS